MGIVFSYRSSFDLITVFSFFLFFVFFFLIFSTPISCGPQRLASNGGAVLRLLQLQLRVRLPCSC